MEIADTPVRSGSDPACLLLELETSYADPADRRILLGGVRGTLEHGLIPLTVEQAAAAADASPATIYRRFGNAKDFRFHVLNFSWTEIVRHLAYADFIGDEGHETGFDQIRSLGANLATCIDSDELRAMVSLAVSADRRPKDTGSNVVELPGKQAFARRLHAVCVRAIKDGSAPAQFMQPVDLAKAVWLEFVPAWISATIVRRNRGGTIAADFVATIQQALDGLFEDEGGSLEEVSPANETDPAGKAIVDPDL